MTQIIKLGRAQVRGAERRRIAALRVVGGWRDRWRYKDGALVKDGATRNDVHVHSWVAADIVHADHDVALVRDARRSSEMYTMFRISEMRKILDEVEASPIPEVIVVGGRETP